MHNLFFYYYFYKQEVKSLISSGDGISGCSLPWGRASGNNPHLMGRWRSGMLRVVAGNFFWLNVQCKLAKEKNKQNQRWLTCEKYYIILRTSHVECSLQQDHRMWMSVQTKKLFATVSLDLNLKVKPRINKFKSELHCFEVFIIYVAVLR